MNTRNVHGTKSQLLHYRSCIDQQVMIVQFTQGPYSK